MWQISSILFVTQIFVSEQNKYLYGRQKFEISVAASQQVAQRMENIMPPKHRVIYIGERDIGEGKYICYG